MNEVSLQWRCPQDSLQMLHIHVLLVAPLGAGPAAVPNSPLSCTSTNPAGRRSTPMLFSRTTPAGCPGDITSCPENIRVVGCWLMLGENLTELCRRFRKRNGRIPWRQPASVIAPGCFSWSSLSWN